MFVAATTIVTVPYTYYHGSLLMSCAVVVGAIFGELWVRSGAAVRTAAAAVLLVVLTASATLYYRETTREKARSNHYSDLLSYVGQKRDAKGMYVPYVFVPTIHYYYPQLTTVGYDVDWRPEDLVSAWVKAGPGWELLCAESTCNALRSRASAVAPVRQTTVVAGGIDTTGEITGENSLEPLYSLAVENR
jgi:hypothetical protein